MSSNIIFEPAPSPSRKVGWGAYLSDFANILKPFVGSIFLAIPFGFKQCGLACGLVGLFVVAVVTAHCCNLLIKCRYHALTYILRLQRHPTNFMLKAYNSRKQQKRLINMQVTESQVDAFMGHLAGKGVIDWPEVSDVEKGEVGNQGVKAEDEEKVFSEKRQMISEGTFACKQAAPAACAAKQKIVYETVSKKGTHVYEEDVEWIVKTTCSKKQQELETDSGKLSYENLLWNHKDAESATSTASEAASDKSTNRRSVNRPAKKPSAKIDDKKFQRMERSLVKNLQYGDLARLCLGSFGVTFTNFLIIVTQIGFCVNYGIVTANIIVSFFPVYDCTVQNGSVVSPDCWRLPNLPWQIQMAKNNTVGINSSLSLRSPLFDVSMEGNNTDNADHTFLAFTTENISPSTSTSQTDGLVFTTGSRVTKVTLPSTSEESLTDLSTSTSNSSVSPSSKETQTSQQTTRASSTLINSSVPPVQETSSETTSVWSSDPESSSTKPTSSSVTSAEYTDSSTTSAQETSSETGSPLTPDSEASSINPASSPITSAEYTDSSSTLAQETSAETTSPITTDPKTSSVNAVSSPVTSTAAAPNSTEMSAVTNSSLPFFHMTWSNAPDLQLAVLVPVAAFVFLILPRKMRVLGVFSAMGNVALVTGIVIVFVALIDEFHLSDSWQWALPQGLPMFFGTVASAFEGAGTILSIEMSMEGNQHNFPLFLFTSIAVLMVMFMGLGILSYLSYGTGVAQLVTMNIAAGSSIGTVVNVCIMLGMLFTFPLMMFPVVKLCEIAIYNIEKEIQNKQETSETTSLLQRKKTNSKSMMKGNLVRIALVLIVGALSVVLRNNFAYVSAFIGALGSTFIALVLPCVFHLRLCWSSIPAAIKIKDFMIVIFGFVICITGIYSVIRDMITGV